MPDASDIKAFLTIPEGSEPGGVRVRGKGSAYVARFRGSRPVDLVKLSSGREAPAEDEPLQFAEMDLGEGGPLQVYFTRRAAILVHDRGRELITAPTPFETSEDVRAAVESGDLRLVAGYEPIPGEPLIELEPPPGAPVTELEPLTGRPVMEIEPQPGGAPPGRYVLLTCPGPPSHLARVLRDHPYCSIHDRELGDDPGPGER